MPASHVRSVRRARSRQIILQHLADSGSRRCPIVLTRYRPMAVDAAKVLLEESQRFFSMARKCKDEKLAQQLYEIGNILLELAHEQGELTESARLTVLRNDE